MKKNLLFYVYSYIHDVKYVVELFEIIMQLIILYILQRIWQVIIDIELFWNVFIFYFNNNY